MNDRIGKLLGCGCLTCCFIFLVDMDTQQKFILPKTVELPRPGKNPDSIKLLVGQVPKTFEEKDLLPYFEQFGPIYAVSILRDKLSHAHKGLLGTVVIIQKHAVAVKPCSDDVLL